MKIFVTGGTGVLGKRVVNLLSEQGNTVAVLSRSQENDKLIQDIDGTAIRGNIFDLHDLIHASRECDCILHLATHIPRKAMPKRSDWALNDRLRAEVTQNLIAAARENQIRRIVIPSLVALYGNRNGEIINTSTPLPQVHNPLLQSAFDMEQLVMNSQLDFSILRYGTFYGEDCFHTKQLLQDVSHRKLPLIGKGDFFMNMIHVEDAAKAMVHVVNNFDRFKNRPINITDFQPQTYANILDEIVKLTRSKSPFSIPRWLAKLVLGDSFGYITASFRIMPDELLNGWKPVHTLNQTLRAVYHEMVNQ